MIVDCHVHIGSSQYLQMDANAETLSLALAHSDRLIPVDDLAQLAHRHSQTRLVLSGPNYLSEFRNAIEAMQRCPNMVIESSCMQGFQAVWLGCLIL